tara:strand:- start:223 stop:465 length:243 start_codon:yes stop_codon:yes gene_type:complete
MAELKTIISANIPVSLAEMLKDKTKGTRSRVVTRALKAYLNDRDAFDITDIPTRQLLAVLHSRDDVSEQTKLMILAELKQ